jgi:transposase
MTRARGRCAKGGRLRSKAPFGHWKTQTFIAGLRVLSPDRAMGHRRANGPRDLRDLCPHPTRPDPRKARHRHPDNRPAHKSPAAQQAIRERGAWLMFLPPYSPDLNPIEMAFAKLKAHLRAMAMRTIDELWKAIGQICDLVKPQECANYFQAAGYGFT